ncbi:hypothetical protein HOP50_11g62430 [Chloropicon primus]|uniref:Uncharacterized protein n=1 Tax=Chloropicon primus TaxID=1764295 RepID=A0A5B8MT43_9CHLO|nr:hypothetical protein A3770_11p62210 [Chloropicon primus]UPR02916.1 hypothetical protein HOP50_11g62430 [Chloropicon primus]|mmetsp:Transcript_8689/g.24826  ORF Transcript_8689/g.24826 Transcript_8689/m.24826 type:complete len:215 (-) Transcript_8689:43-687(-)|eukprot:QDZ23703.1 hypothetical protein A3770_11p62210 [Chloropicon primus]
MSSDEDREWELLEDGSQDGGRAKKAASMSASELVESFWRKARGASAEEKARLSCEDIIERSEEALGSTVLSKAHEARGEGSEGGEGGEAESQATRVVEGDQDYRLFEPFRSRMESALSAVLYGFDDLGGESERRPPSPLLWSAISSKTVLSLGVVNFVLLCSLVQSYAKSHKLTAEVDKRGAIIYRLVSKLYEAQMNTYSAVPMPQYHYQISIM